MRLLTSPPNILGMFDQRRALGINLDHETTIIPSRWLVSDGAGASIVIHKGGEYTILELMVRITNMREGNL